MEQDRGLRHRAHHQDTQRVRINFMASSRKSYNIKNTHKPRTPLSTVRSSEKDAIGREWCQAGATFDPRATWMPLCTGGGGRKEKS